MGVLATAQTSIIRWSSSLERLSCRREGYPWKRTRATGRKLSNIYKFHFDLEQIDEGLVSAGEIITLLRMLRLRGR